MSGGNPEALRVAQEGMSGTATEIRGVAEDVSAALRACAGAFGDDRVEAALERFGAAYGGELLAGGLSVETLGKAAVTNADLLDAVTGGDR
ncbi:hypothetical protein CLV30_101294 [Haloactinopolyspora alba]|uniref:Uncharacterized protein n=1 Tax=Haloactinopolyspora alba TaxID=648780 RepID=A0A2P8EFS8_9ACTN|nr:hypothetical protein [Haloactinopolyspora alba]PSL08323.1 hypothetical protein CLV30_101294 [Haloactinopolyspora alba]